MKMQNITHKEKIALSKMGAVLKRLRTGRAMTQKAVGDRIGWSRTIVSGMERGADPWRFDKVSAVSRLFGVTEAEFARQAGL